VQRHADRLLKEASAYGRFPTPVADILDAAKLTVVDDELLDANVLQKFLRKARTSVLGGMAAIKSAVSKLLGLFEPHDRLVVIDKDVPRPRIPFVKLHEAGHGYLPHQSGLYALIQDCEQTLDPDTTDLFEREANVFASETLFQRERFAEEANGRDFGIKVPMDMAKMFGASNYSAFRRYITSSPHICCVVVLEPPTYGGSKGTFVAGVRRVVASKSFQSRYDCAKLFPVVTQDHPIAKSVPRGKKQRFTPEREVVLTDRNQDQRVCTVEAFDTKHQILILVRDIRPFNKSVIMPSSVSRVVIVRPRTLG
jgi:hypothetical protein